MIDDITPQLPYFIRAINEWILDNNLTPYLMVHTFVGSSSRLSVPVEHIDEDGKIIFNISPSAVRDLVIGNDEITFNARFNGIEQHIVIPIYVVMTIYAQEVGPTMFFNDPDDTDDYEPTDPEPDKKSQKPSLRVVK